MLYHRLRRSWWLKGNPSSIAAVGSSVGEAILDFVKLSAASAEDIDETCSESTDADGATSSLTCELNSEEKMHAIAYRKVSSNGREIRLSATL